MPEFLLEGLWKIPKDSGYSILGRDLTQDFPITEYCQAFLRKGAIQSRHKQKKILKLTLDRSCFIRSVSP